MAGEPEITVTRGQMAAAIGEWRETSRAEGYDVPDDRDDECADYLFHLLRKHGAG